MRFPEVCSRERDSQRGRRRASSSSRIVLEHSSRIVLSQAKAAKPSSYGYLLLSSRRYLRFPANSLRSLPSTD